MTSHNNPTMAIRVSPSFFLLGSIIVFLILQARPADAFGAGNIASISRIEGQNWRHGDIEDALLNLLIARSAGGKKFSKMDVKRVYFGNWLRDYSQAIDVGTVKAVSSEVSLLLPVSRGQLLTIACDRRSVSSFGSSRS